MLKVTVPRMTTEARELLVKQARTLGKHGLTLILPSPTRSPSPHQARKLGEAGKTAVRNVRQAAMKRAKGHPDKEERRRAEKEVEAASSAATAKLAAAVEAKVKDLKTV